MFAWAFLSLDVGLIYMFGAKPGWNMNAETTLMNKNDIYIYIFNTYHISLIQGPFRTIKHWILPYFSTTSRQRPS